MKKAPLQFKFALPLTAMNTRGTSILLSSMHTPSRVTWADLLNLKILEQRLDTDA